MLHLGILQDVKDVAAPETEATSLPVRMRTTRALCEARAETNAHLAIAGRNTRSNLFRAYINPGGRGSK
jgi:hypothetical protein